MTKITCVIPTEAHHRAELEKAAAQKAEINYIDKSALTADALADSEVILGNVPTSLLSQCKKLKWLQLGSAGSDEYVAEGVLPKSCLLTNSSGAYGLAISEHMIGTLLEIYKKLNLYRDNQTNCLWRDEGRVETIEGKTVLIVGLGDIGGTFAMKMQALGAYTIGVRRTKQGRPPYIDELYTPEELDKLLPRADIVALSLPHTAQTERLFSRERIAMMKDNAVLINVGRGSAVDTEALCDALESGKLLGASVDVIDPEPLPPEHRIWKIKNAVITPHISGYFHLKETHDRIITIAAKNILRYFSGERLINMVDFSTGYREVNEN